MFTNTKHALHHKTHVYSILFFPLDNVSTLYTLALFHQKIHGTVYYKHLHNIWVFLESINVIVHFALSPLWPHYCLLNDLRKSERVKVPFTIDLASRHILPHPQNIFLKGSQMCYSELWMFETRESVKFWALLISLHAHQMCSEWELLGFSSFISQPDLSLLSTDYSCMWRRFDWQSLA